jgi:uncharacterized protein YecE (DUF72 family)
MRAGAVYVGTSGWSYDHWQGILYPDRTPVGKRLPYYLEHGYDTVEVNNTFYRWPKPSTFEGWREAVPPGFRLTIKASRGLTQFKKLNEPEAWVERMTEGLDRLGDRLGVLLVQLPPHFPQNLPRLDHFLGIVPDRFPVAMEFRHDSWHTDETYEVLERHGAAYCVMSGARLPCVLKATAPFVYVRLHGPDPDWLYAGSYSDDDLRWWAYRIKEWRAQGRDVWAYFNNDPYGHAIRNADTLRALVGDIQ